MKIASYNILVQCYLALQHADRVIRAMCDDQCVKDVLLCVCYVAHPDIIPLAKETWKKYLNNHDEVVDLFIFLILKMVFLLLIENTYKRPHFLHF